MQYIKENIEAIEKRMQSAALRAGRQPNDVQLLAVTKTVDIERINASLEYGVRHIGENKAQEYQQKRNLLKSGVFWHFIGQLQSNKVKYIIKDVYMIHSLDRPSLAVEIDRQAKREGRVIPVLLEVNVAAEERKGGLLLNEVKDFVDYAASLPNLSVQGLMTVAPMAEDPEEVRPVFRALRTLGETIRNCRIPRVDMRYLSMGMSGDFEVAIEEGANWVRIGQAIYGRREA